MLRIIGDAGGNLSDPDNTAPADYSAAIDQAVINNANKQPFPSPSAVQRLEQPITRRYQAAEEEV